MEKVRLSAALICGDAHVGILGRCLNSIMRAPGGPAADEIVIGWNGKQLPNFTEALVKTFLPHEEFVYINALRSGEPLEVYVQGFPTKVRLVLHEYTWINDFADARNNNFDHTSGEWVYYIDVDDLLVGADHPAYADSMEQDPPPGTVESYPVKGSLPEFFAGLPPHFNVVLAPYNYVNSEAGRPMIRKRRPRAVRWSEGHFLWTSEIHEVLVSAYAREIPVWAPGFLLVHDPVVKVEERGARNQAVLDSQIARLRAENIEIPASVVYSSAATAMAAKRYGEALQKYEEAAARAQTAEDKHFYTLMAARSAMEDANYAKAGQLALAAIDYAPLRPEGYLMASEASYRLYQFAKCITWYEAAKGKRPPTGGPMFDDRFERCLRPVAFAGVAYIREGRYQEALGVAEIALRESPGEKLAQRVKAEAEEGIKHQAVAGSATALVNALLALGFSQTAQRVLSKLTEFGDFRALNKSIDRALAAETTALPEGPVSKWLTEGPTSLAYPLDAAEDPDAMLDALAARVDPGEPIRVASTDPASGAPYATLNRVDAINGERLLGLLERQGDVETLVLMEDGNGRFLTGEVKVQKTKRTTPRKPDITFFCPVFAEPWGPWRLLRHGTGGSEEAVIYLARELAERGLAIDVYAPLDPSQFRSVHVEGGVRWRPLDAFDAVKPGGTTIVQRAPWALRIPAIDIDRVYLWHQDADYMVGWNTAVAIKARHLWVSKWQRDRLIGVANADPNAVRGVVCGNGVPFSATEIPFPETRDPLSCCYISSPARGLRNLLDVWEFVLASFPEAHLRVYYGWETARIIPGMSAFQAETMALVRRLKNVEYVGRLPQTALEKDLVNHGVWTYPLNFPEAFCNAGIRAAAAGLVPVYRQVAAMPEIQCPSNFAVPDTDWAGTGAREFLEALLKALEASKNGTAPRAGYREYAKRWTWKRVAEAVIANMEKEGLL